MRDVSLRGWGLQSEAVYQGTTESNLHKIENKFFLSGIIIASAWSSLFLCLSWLLVRRKLWIDSTLTQLWAWVSEGRYLEYQVFFLFILSWPTMDIKQWISNDEWMWMKIYAVLWCRFCFPLKVEILWKYIFTEVYGHFGLNFTWVGSHNLSTRRARRTKSRSF